MTKVLSILFVISVFYSCKYFKAPKEPKSIARVGDEYLFESDLDQIVPKDTNVKDSLAIVTAYINQWATKRLLLNGALDNLSANDIAQFNVLIENYKTDLYTKAYLEGLVNSQIDTLITENQIVSYYEKNKQFFKSSNILVKLRYINLVKENTKIETIKSKFNSFTKNDISVLQDLAIDFKSYAFNDSLWVEESQVFERLPFITLDNKNEFISPGKSMVYSDSTTMWLVKIRDVLPTSEPTPLQFIKPTIKQVILNNRKLELLKSLEKDILTNAKKNNTYELYK